MANGTFEFSLAKQTSAYKDTIVNVFKVKTSGFTAFAFQCKLNWDKDGDPMCYGLNNPNPVDQNADTALQRGLEVHDGLSNAADPYQNCTFHLNNPGAASSVNPFRWVGLMSSQADDPPHFRIDRRPFLEARGWRDNEGNLHTLAAGEPGFFPIIQRRPSPGNYVSSTAVTTGVGLGRWDQNSYVNAVEIPYFAGTSERGGWWSTLGVHLGDFGLVIWPDTGTNTGFVFADTGAGKVGEVSTKVFSKLAPGQSPYAVNENTFVFLVFPGSGTASPPRDKYTQEAVVQQQAKANIEKLNDISYRNELVLFLALGADKSRFEQVREGAAINQDPRHPLGMRYQNILNSLRNYGFQSPRPGPVPEPRAPIRDFPDVSKQDSHIA